MAIDSTTQTLTWNGDAVIERVRKAAIAGVNRVMGACVAEAKSSHTWQNRTGILEGGISIIGYAAPVDGGVQGTWGVQDVVYARIQELGGTIVPTRAKALKIPMPDGTFRFVQKVFIPPRPFLRPAADAKYPSLPAAIRAAYDASGPAPAEGGEP